MFSKEKSIFPSIDFFEAKNMLDFRGFSEIDGSIDSPGVPIEFFLGWRVFLRGAILRQINLTSWIWGWFLQDFSQVLLEMVEEFSNAQMIAILGYFLVSNASSKLVKLSVSFKTIFLGGKSTP